MPSGVADGALIIDTGLDNSGFIRDAGQFRRAVESMVQAVQKSGQQMGQSMNGYLKALQQASGASKSAASGQSALEKEIAKTEAAIARLNERQAKMKALAEQRAAEQRQQLREQMIEETKAAIGHGNWEIMPKWSQDQAIEQTMRDFEGRLKAIQAQPVENTDAWRSLQYDIDQSKQKLAAMRAELAANREEGASAGGGVAAAFANIAQTAGKAAGAVAKIAGNAALSFLKKLAAGAKNAAIQLAKLAGRAVVTGLRKIGQLAGGAAKKLFGLGDAAKGGGDGFKHSLKNLMRYGLGIRSLFFLFNKLRTAVKEGFDAMAGSDERVAAALASLKGALSGLKGSLAAAFAPILTAVAPALTTLINLLKQAVNAIGMFFAAITGQGYFMAAKGMESVGSAAGSASGSVKELKRQLAGFDELNILSANNSGGSGGGGGGGASNGYSYEKLPVAGFIADFAEQLKALVEAENWDGLGRLLAGKINGAFDKARQLISWDNLGGRITKAVDAIAGTFNGLVDGINWTGIGQTLAEGLNTVLYTVNRLITGVDWANLGKKLAEGLNGMVGRVDWTAMGELFRNKLQAALDMLLEAVRTFRWSEAGDAIARFLNGLYNPEAFTKLADLLSTGINGAVTALTRALEGFDWGQAATDFASSVNRLVQDVDWTKLGNLLGEGIQSAITMVKNFVSTINWADAGQALARSLNGLADQINPEDVGQAISNALKGALDFLNNFFSELDSYQMGQDLMTALEEIDWEGIKDKLFELVENLFDGLGEFIVGMIVKSLFKEGSPLANLMELINPGSSKLLPGMSEFVGNTLGGKKTSGGKSDEATIEAGSVTVTSGKITGGPNAENTIPLESADKVWEKTQKELQGNTEALNRNTKIEVKKVRRIEPTYTRTLFHNKHEQLMYETGAGSAGTTISKMNGQTVDIGLNFLPLGVGGLNFINKPLAWLQKMFAPGTDTQTRIELVKKIANQTPATLFETSKILGVFASLFKKDNRENPGWLFGTGLGVFASLFKKDNRENPSWLYGTALSVLSSLSKKDSKETPSWLYGTALSVLSSLSKKDSKETPSWLYGTALSVLSTLAKKPGTKDTDDLYKKNIDVTATIKKAKNNEISWTVTQSQVAGNKLVLMAKAMGGVITSGGRSLDWWGSAMKYAGGTSRAHGTMFVAGEAGPEIVGHVNGRTEILNQSQLAQTMRSAVASGMLAALKGVTFTMPAMATGGVMPYEVSAQIAKSAADIQGTLNANNEDLIQTIISVAGQLVAAVGRIQPGQSAGGMTAQQVIDEINRRTLMFGASPLKGV